MNLNKSNNMTLFGDKWFQIFSQFRINPKEFFDKRKLTPDAFSLDLLWDIYVDDIDVQYKIHLLILLQENSASLIRDFNLLHQIIGSLVNLFNVLKSNRDNRLLKSQILITISTVLLTADVECDVQELVSSIKKLLLNVISDESSDCVIISSACKCLEEIEIFFPNLLEFEVKNILSSCEKHLSPAFQNYAILLSCCIKNICSSPSSMKLCENESEKSECKDGIHLSNIVSYLVELIPLMSPMSAYKVLKNLTSVVKQSDSISPMVFKLYLPSLIFSSEVPFIHLSLDFLEAFHQDLFTVLEENSLLRQLFLLATHPCLTVSHRMLFLDWLKSCLLDKTIFSYPFPMFKCLLPGPFDGPVTQEKKSSILALYVPQNSEESIEILNESVSGLKSCALLPHGTKAAASFFRTLFVHISYHKSDYMQDYIYKLLLGIMKTCPHLLKYALCFLDSVKHDFPESILPKNVFTHLVDHIISLPLKQFANNLECNLAILERSSEICGSASKPRSILRLLQKLLGSTYWHAINAWEFGNDILSVCRSILTFHDVQIFYYDLAEVLCLISQNIEDIDVKDRAKMYYSVLTSLSKLKVQSLFKSQVANDLKIMTSLEPGGNTNLQFAPSIQVLTKPVLQLIRIKKKWDVIPNNNSMLPVVDIDILKVYYQHLNMFNPVVHLPFILKHTADSENIFNNLYGVVISVQTSLLCKEISDIELPVFKKTTSSEENVLQIEIMPMECQPTELQFKMRFTCSNGCNYVSYPNPVFLNFKDLFLTLPVPPELERCNPSWKRSLFENLWEELAKKTSKMFGEMKCCKSVLCLKVSKEELSVIINEHWQQFIIEKFNEHKCWIAIFLPPRSHLLMKVDIINEKPFINILVDDISILPWTAVYLQEIVKY